MNFTVHDRRKIEFSSLIVVFCLKLFVYHFFFYYERTCQIYCIKWAFFYYMNFFIALWFPLVRF